MARHQHQFERLSDVAIFCACGAIKKSPYVPAPAIAYPVYVPPVCTRPHYPYVPYAPWVPNYWWANGTGDFLTGGTTITSVGVPQIGTTYIVEGTEQFTYTQGGTA